MNTIPRITLRDDIPADILGTLRDIYLDAFAPEERRPWDAIVTPAVPGQPRLRAIYAGDTPAGMVTTWDLGGVTYVEHLCINPAARGNGLGAAVIAALIDDARTGLPDGAAHPAPLLLEVEPAGSTPMATRRIDFYRRCGLDVIDTTYIQPPYAPGLPSVPLWIMSTDTALDPAPLHTLLHTRVYNAPEP